MTAQHARPLVAYLCVAVAAALLLVAQAVSVPRHVPVVSGVIGGAGSLDLGVDVVLAPLQGDDEAASIGGAVPRRVAERRAVLRPASATPGARRAVAPVRPRATGGQAGAVRSGGPRTHQPQRAKASGPAPQASRPGKARTGGKAHPRASLSRTSASTSLRSSLREVRVSQRGWQRGKGHGRSLRKG